MKIIQTVFSCILRFSTTLSSCALPSHLHLFHSLTRTHRKFRETAGLLMKGEPISLPRVLTLLLFLCSNNQTSGERLPATSGGLSTQTKLQQFLWLALVFILDLYNVTSSMVLRTVLGALVDRYVLKNRYCSSGMPWRMFVRYVEGERGSVGQCDALSCPPDVL